MAFLVLLVVSWARGSLLCPGMVRNCPDPLVRHPVLPRVKSPLGRSSACAAGAVVLGPCGVAVAGVVRLTRAKEATSIVARRQLRKDSAVRAGGDALCRTTDFSLTATGAARTGQRGWACA